MKHQLIIDQWADLLKKIAATRATTDNADAHTCLDAFQKLAEDHSAIMAEKLEASKKASE